MNPLSIYTTSTLLENKTQKCLVYLKWLRYLLWLLHLHYARAFERENKTLFITGRRAAAGKLLGIECWQVVRLCDWLCEQVVMFSIGCADCGWFVWGGGRWSPPPLFEALIEHSTLSLVHCLSSTHYGRLYAHLIARETRSCTCIFWFGFRVGFRKNHDLERSIFSAFVLPCVHVNSSEFLVELRQCHLFHSICSFHLWLYGPDWQYGSLCMCVCTSVLVLSASAFSVYSPCLFLGGLIVPF